MRPQKTPFDDPAKVIEPVANGAGVLVVDGKETRVEPMLRPSRGLHLSGPAAAGALRPRPPRGVGLVRRSGHTEHAGLFRTLKAAAVVRAPPRFAELAARTNEAMSLQTVFGESHAVVDLGVGRRRDA